MKDKPTSYENLFKDVHTPTVYFNYSDFTCVISQEVQFVPLHLLSNLLVGEL